MDSFRPQRSPANNRFIGLFPQPETPGTAVAAVTGVHDLEEDEIFSTEFHSPEPIHRSPNPPSSSGNSIPNPSPPSRLDFRRLRERKIGILAALPEEDNNNPLLHRSISSYSSSSPSSSSSSSARLIPVISKPKADYVLSLKGGRIYHQSAPMNVPVMPFRASRESAELDRDVMGHADVEEEEMLPPHEIVARASSKESPMTTFSMLEGVGRTLKGRDLRRVRNAVWRQTGFQD